jgi:hypothetical protein
MSQITQFPIDGRNPEDTPVTRQTIQANDKFVLQNGNMPKVITTVEAVKLFAPIINNAQLNYTPNPTNNTQNLNEIVTAANGKRYFIDIYGNSTPYGRESKGRYDSIESAIDGGLQDGDFFTMNNPNSPLHGALMELII